jgi:hypothetical protein
MKAMILFIFGVTLTFSAASDDLKPLDSKVMLPGYCYVGSRPDKKALGGYGVSDNLPKKMRGADIGLDGVISLVAVPTNTIPFSKSARGFNLLLINRTKSEVAFEASDSRPSIIQEALDPDGKWQPIEYLPSSWCGNSYHRVFLPAGYYWKFSVPEYGGTRKTKLRFVLQGKQPVYSNQFDGSINPEQFTGKKEHTATNLMDPYGK